MNDYNNPVKIETLRVYNNSAKELFYIVFTIGFEYSLSRPSVSQVVTTK